MGRWRKATSMDVARKKLSEIFKKPENERDITQNLAAFVTLRAKRNRCIEDRRKASEISTPGGEGRG